MSLFKECPECGAALDPGERCDCQKEKDCPHANEISPKPTADITPLSNSIAHKREKVNINALKKLREDKQIPAKDIVILVQTMSRSMTRHCNQNANAVKSTASTSNPMRWTRFLQNTRRSNWRMSGANGAAVTD